MKTSRWEPDIQVRCFSYEDAGILVPGTGTTVWKFSISRPGDMDLLVNDLSIRLEKGILPSSIQGISMPPAVPSIPA